MTENRMLSWPFTLRTGDKRTVLAQEAWLIKIKPGTSLRLEMKWDRDTAPWEAAENQLLLLNRVDVRVLQGQLTVRPLRLSILSKLLAFADEARDTLVPSAAVPHWAQMPPHDLKIWQDLRRCEYWFLLQILNPSALIEPLIALLRQTESYCLVRFLLAQSVHGNTLLVLGERYGVSYSHFRRLCQQALGSSAKMEMRVWRMARSVLEMTDREHNLTHVAIKHGYASSAHFSNEIKELLGTSPRDLSNIIRLANK